MFKWFHPSKVATKVVTLFIRQQSGHPWPTWGAIPKDCEELYFQHFKVTYPSVNELVQWLKLIVMLILFYLIWNCKHLSFLPKFQKMIIVSWNSFLSTDKKSRGFITFRKCFHFWSSFSITRMSPYFYFVSRKHFLGLYSS